jgi:hypothetical protein
MRASSAAFIAAACAWLAAPAPVLASGEDPQFRPESREAYLARLKDICAVECLEPKPFQRAARKRKGEGDMAVIMDVAYVRLNGERFELFNLDLESNALETVQLLGSAGINTSQSNGVGGLSRSRNGALSPEVVVVSLDRQAFADFLNPLEPVDETVTTGAAARTDGDILVEGEQERKAERRKPTLAELKALFRNRRIVVRGTPELTPTWVGARLDHKNKQVSLMVRNADDLVLLPRYDDEGNPVLEDELAGLAAQPVADGK